MAALWFLAGAALVGLMVKSGVRHWVAVVPAALVLLWVFSAGIHDRREVERAEESLREAGVDVPDEQPPPVRLAESPDSLVASAIFLLLLALTFVAHLFGWLRLSD